MVKHFNIIMAGVISGIVALCTTFLGVSGTVIGSVLSSVLYQVLSSYSQEKYEEGTISTTNIAGEIVYIFPLIVIAIIELIYFMTSMHYHFVQIFNVLEAATQQNLFRVMGLGMILLSFYPLLNSNSIKKYNGFIVFFVGFLVLLRGLVDLNSHFVNLYELFFDKFDFIFALLVVLALAFVIINIIFTSINTYSGAKKVDTNGMVRGYGNKPRKYDGDEYYGSEYNNYRPHNLDQYENHSDGHWNSRRLNNEYDNYSGRYQNPQNIYSEQDSYYKNQNQNPHYNESYYNNSHNYNGHHAPNYNHDEFNRYSDDDLIYVIDPNDKNGANQPSKVKILRKVRNKVPNNNSINKIKKMSPINRNLKEENNNNHQIENGNLDYSPKPKKRFK